MAGNLKAYSDYFKNFDTASKWMLPTRKSSFSTTKRVLLLPKRDISIKLAQHLYPIIKKEFASINLQKPSHAFALAEKIDRISNQKPSWIKSDQFFEIFGYPIILRAAISYFKNTNLTSKTLTKNQAIDFLNSIEKHVNVIPDDLIKTAELPKTYTVAGKKIQIALTPRMRQAFLRKLAEHDGDLNKLLNAGGTVRTPRMAIDGKSPLISNISLPSFDHAFIGKAQHVLRIQVFGREHPTLRGFWTKEGRTSNYVRNHGIRTPKFHGFVMQNGKLIEIHDLVNNSKRLSDRMPSKDLSLKQANAIGIHIAQRHANNIADLDCMGRTSPENLLIDNKDQVWMIDHQLVLTGKNVTQEMKKAEFNFYKRHISFIGKQHAIEFETAYNQELQRRK